MVSIKKKLNNLQVKINFSNLKITTKKRGTKSKGEII